MANSSSVSDFNETVNTINDRLFSIADEIGNRIVPVSKGAVLGPDDKEKLACALVEVDDMCCSIEKEISDFADTIRARKVQLHAILNAIPVSNEAQEVR